MPTDIYLREHDIIYALRRTTDRFLPVRISIYFSADLRCKSFALAENRREKNPRPIGSRRRNAVSLFYFLFLSFRVTRRPRGSPEDYRKNTADKTAT